MSMYLIDTFERFDAAPCLWSRRNARTGFLSVTGSKEKGKLFKFRYSGYELTPCVILVSLYIQTTSSSVRLTFLAFIAGFKNISVHLKLLSASGVNDECIFDWRRLTRKCMLCCWVMIESVHPHWQSQLDVPLIMVVGGKVGKNEFYGMLIIRFSMC